MTVSPIIKPCLVAGILYAIAINPLLWASDVAELHRSKCIACHAKMTGGDGGVLYKRNDSIVQNKSQLIQRVEYCAQGAHTNWNSEQVSAVAQYLNELIYQFP